MVTNLLRPVLLFGIWLNVVFAVRSKRTYSCNADRLPGYNASFGPEIISGGKECRILHRFKGKFSFSVKLCENPHEHYHYHEQKNIVCDAVYTIIVADVEGTSTVRPLNHGETAGNAKFCLTISYLDIYPSFPFEINCGKDAVTNAWVVRTENNPSVTGESVNVDEVINSSDRNRSISESERRPDAFQSSCVVLTALFVVALLCILVLLALLIYFRSKWKTPHHKTVHNKNGEPGVQSESIIYVSKTPNSGIYTGLNHVTHYQDLNGHYTALHETNRPASYLVPATYQDVK